MVRAIQHDAEAELGNGPISAAVAVLLAREPSAPARLEPEVEAVRELAAGVADPLGDDDLHLGLYLGFEIHFRSLPWIHPRREWDPSALAVRAALEGTFLGALTGKLPPLPVDPEAVGEELFRLEAADQGPSMSRRLERTADLDQFREFVVHRYLYQRKEADPHSWAIPRLTGAPKSALLEVQHDEYGAGRPERIHSELFAKTMRELGLDSTENAYLERVPGRTLATVNLMSALGLCRARRGAIVGHLAMFEMTSALPNRRYGNGLRRLGFGSAATDFYDEHVEADAMHENIAAYDLAGGLARQEPMLAADIFFGARAMLFVENRFARAVLGAWDRGESSLRRPL